MKNTNEQELCANDREFINTCVININQNYNNNNEINNVQKMHINQLAFKLKY